MKTKKNQESGSPSHLFQQLGCVYWQESVLSQKMDSHNVEHSVNLLFFAGGNNNPIWTVFKGAQAGGPGASPASRRPGIKVQPRTF